MCLGRPYYLVFDKSSKKNDKNTDIDGYLLDFIISNSMFNLEIILNFIFQNEYIKHKHICDICAAEAILIVNEIVSNLHRNWRFQSGHFG